MPSSRLEVHDLFARYEDVEALRGISLIADGGEFLAVVGPSGCGKTTLLRCLAGFIDPSAGRICLGDETIADERTALPPEKRGVGIVFQNYALWPHMTALENVAYPWKVRGIDPRERTRRAADLLAQLGLPGLEQRRPAELSGGQQQRVALARALACEPRLLLLDEPLSNVDATLRQSLQDLILDTAKRNGLTTVLATHDLAEAFALADKVVLMRDGRIVQEGTPAEVQEMPENGFVARFLGRNNVVPVDVLAAGPGMTEVRLPDGEQMTVPAQSRSPGPALLVIRPVDVNLGPAATGLCGIVIRSVPHDGRTLTRVRIGMTEFHAWEPDGQTRASGDRLDVTFSRALLLPPDTE